MLRVIFCMNCCSVPKTSRPVRGKANVVRESEQLVEEANFKSLLPLGASEKEQLFERKGESTNNNNYGTNEDNSRQDDDSQGRVLVGTQEMVPDEPTEADSLARSTSSRLQRETSQIDFSESVMKFYDERSISPPSSIDIEQFKENTSEDHLTKSQGYFGSSSQQANDERERKRSEPGLSATMSSRNIPSTTRIGDYARIEYSPVEDLEPVTTRSPSRGGSQKGSQLAERSATQSRQSSPDQLGADYTADKSRRSSQGIESSSISIASQLSGEQLQQNLTNMLESGTSPLPLFGTIGLPLGPPLEILQTETAKTTPETTGAALTSASQDSLTDASLTSATAQASGRITATNGSSNGGALVNDSNGLSDNDESLPAESTIKSAQKIISESLPTERLGSPISMATTTSGGFTDPTPTPSEMSAGSSAKRSRLMLGPRALLKKLKPLKKKKKGNNDEVVEKK